MEPLPQTATLALRTVGELLHELGVEKYIYEVTKRSETWEVRLAYATDRGWKKSVTILDANALAASASTPEVRRDLVAFLARGLPRAKYCARANVG